MILGEHLSARVRSAINFNGWKLRRLCNFGFIPTPKRTFSYTRKSIVDVQGDAYQEKCKGAGVGATIESWRTREGFKLSWKREVCLIVSRFFKETTLTWMIPTSCTAVFCKRQKVFDGGKKGEGLGSFLCNPTPFFLS